MRCSLFLTLGLPRLDFMLFNIHYYSDFASKNINLFIFIINIDTYLFMG